MVGRPDHHGVDVRAGEEVAEVGVLVGERPVFALEGVCGFVEVQKVHVADRRDLDAGLAGDADGVAESLAEPAARAARADQRDANLVVGPEFLRGGRRGGLGA